MALITTTELNDVAAERGIDLSTYTDDRLGDIIDYMEQELQARTGRVFTEQTFTETRLEHNGRLYQTRHYPISSTGLTVKVDDTTLDSDAYSVDTQLGQILLSLVHYSYTLEVTYTTSIPGDQSLAKKILIDLCLLEIVNEGDDQELRSFSDGDYSATYTEKSRLDKQITRLQRLGATSL